MTWTLFVLFVIQILSLVKFLTPASGLQGYWDPYPIDMEFRPPCMVLSTIGISKPGKLEGQSTRECATHLHQLHVCLPSSRQKTRLLYRMSLDFAAVLKHIPFMHYLWRHFAEQVQNFPSVLLYIMFIFTILLLVCTKKPPPWHHLKRCAISWEFSTIPPVLILLNPSDIVPRWEWLTIILTNTFAIKLLSHFQPIFKLVWNRSWTRIYDLFSASKSGWSTVPTCGIGQYPMIN